MRVSVIMTFLTKVKYLVAQSRDAYVGVPVVMTAFS